MALKLAVLLAANARPLLRAVEQSRRAFDSLEREEKQLARAADKMDREHRQAATGLRGAASEAALFANALRGAGASAAIVATTVGALAVPIARAGDQVKLLRAQLDALGAAAVPVGTLFDAASRLGVEVDTVAESFRRFSIARDELGLTNAEVLRLTETVIALGRLSGASASELTAGSIQLAQALASGRLQGDELRSVLENMPLLAKELASELGVSVGQLRQMGADGELTGRKIAEAILRAGERIQDQFESLPDTMETAGARLSNAWSQLLAALDQKLQASELFVFFTDTLARALDGLRLAISGPEPGSFQAAARVVEIDREIFELETRIAQLREQASSSIPGRAAAARIEIRKAREEIETLRREQQALIEAGREAAAVAAAAADRKQPAGRPSDGAGGGAPKPDFLPGPPANRDAILAERAGEARLRIEEKLAQAMRRRELLELRLATVGQESADRIVAARERELEVLDAGLSLQDEAARKWLEEAAAVEELNARLEEQQRKVDEAKRKAQQFGDTIADAFEDAVFEARSLSDAVASLAEDLARLVFRQQITQPLANLIAGRLSGLFQPSPGPAGVNAISFGGASIFAAGGIVDHGHVVPFAAGGIVDRPTLFPLADGTGLMGEAGPEAIMPLTRLPNGRLGVEAQGSGKPVTVTVRIIDQRSSDDPPLEVSQRQAANGGAIIDAVVKRALFGMARRGELDGLMNAFGARRVPQ